MKKSSIFGLVTIAVAIAVIISVYNKGQERKVVFTGTKPQDFERSEQIVLTGQMVGNEFKASSILMKCPSKYNNDKVETEFKAKQASI